MDISQGIPKQCTIHYCKGCERYLQPPTNWVRCELESRELLSICLKKLKGLDKVRLVDAGFIWTESHSKRIKVKVTIQKEVFKGTILQSIFVVEYIVGSQYCEDCTRVDSNLTWKAVVQVRQKVPHKRTFLWLEQIILKHDAHRDTSNLKEFRDGLDFYYAKIPHAIKMVDFLSSFVPTRMKQSEQLISSDIHSGTSDYKLSYSLEIAPICKDDLVCLPLKLAKSLGNIDQLVVCTRVGTSLIFTSPRTNQKCELRCLNYWEHYFFPLCDRRELVEFYVIDIQHGKPSLVEVSKSTNLSVTWLVNTHLGHILNAGDHCLGYFLENTNFNNEHFSKLSPDKVPDVVLVRKSYLHRPRRKFQIRAIQKEQQEKGDKGKENDGDRDLEMFMRDVEEDVELRGMVNLYKNSNAPAHNDSQMEEEDEDEDFPEIAVGELLDDMDQMDLND